MSVVNASGLGHQLQPYTIADIERAADNLLGLWG